MPAEHPDMLMRSKHLSYFAQHGQVYAYHDLFGYLMAMSRDLADLLQFHHVTLRTREEVDSRFEGQFDSEQLDEFLSVFRLFGCLIESELAEWRSLWSMFPVRARWVVFHQPSEDQLTFWRTSRQGGSGQGDSGQGDSGADPVEPWAARMWALFDGETKLEEIYEQVKDDVSLSGHDNPREHVLKVVTSWVHHDRQYLKFSKGGVSRYGPEHQWPSYLRSTMPFPPYRPGVDPDPVDPLEAVAVPINPPHAYYENDVVDAEAQFQDVETTLSHLFRDPHPLLNGASYSQRIADALIERGQVSGNTVDVMEVGAGQGHFAAGFLTRLKERDPATFDQLNYTIVDLAPALRERQKETLAAVGLADRVTWVAANAETHDFGAETIDLLLCNEVVGDFTTVKLTREIVGLTQELEPEKAFAAWSERTRERLGEAGRLIRDYAMPLRDAPDEFFFILGGALFVEKVGRALRRGGAAFITEYGESVKYPTASTHLDHVEFSTHFGHLKHLAERVGMTAQLEYVQDLIRLDREAHTLATTRTYFASLRALLAANGAHLDKQAYSKEMFEALLASAGLTPEHVGDVRYPIIDERCMGLCPHEFKALMLRKE